MAVEDPLDAFAPAALAAKLGRPVERVLIRTSLLEALLQPSDGQAPTDGQRNFAATDEGIGHDLDRLRDLASDEPVIRFVNAMIDRAVDLRASDIHVTRTSHGSRLRYRIDGVLRDMEPPPAGMHAAVISRVKIMSGLDIAERRLPQDGRTRVSFRGRELDLRVATMPHAHGEGVVLRLLDRTAVPLDLRTLGLSPHVVTPLSAALERPNGIVLVTGPTGSGKSTTLYAALRTIQGPSKNIVTVEDPIEHYLDGISQIQVSRQIGFDFANVLRAILRQDPDVIMIGEIRDRETAIVAVQAALTGHLVLATVHTNSAAGALPRLVDMGVEPFLLASCLRGVLSQRLVRTLCPQCRQPAAFRADDPMAAPGSIADAFEARGCAHCAQTGFKGRSAIAEFLPAADEIRDALLRGADAATIDAAGRRHGLIPLIEDGRDKVREGVTTTAELLRVSGDDGG
ncbi:general secretion pathway protein E [Kaistia hirudinis]|uniref:General secretion pathway protein E n=1 Tax=Kaistia hirudinis TaxID=1293440 RepID=A0A840ALD8_9HYPH|nr:general secretion pathway protein E [Kaistia hirudinis]